jgi:hypothetical protein
MQFVRIIIFGLIAPLRRPIGLVLASLPWLALTLTIQVKTAANRSWVPFLGFGGQGWHYEAFEWEYSLRFAQLLSAIPFVLLWMRWVARLPLIPHDILDLGLRLLRVGIAVFKLAVVAFGLFVVWLVALRVAYDWMGDWYWVGAGLLQTGIGIWLGCRLAAVLASAALDDEPGGVRRAWRMTSGAEAWVLLALMVPLLISAILKVYLLKGLGDTGSIVFQDLLFDIRPFWKFAWQLDPVPLSIIVQGVLVTWLQCAWTLATLALAYRHLSMSAEGTAHSAPHRA